MRLPNYWFIPQIEKTDSAKADTIINLVCKELNIEFKLINIRKRTQEVAFPRQLIQFFLYHYTNLSLNGIGRKFQGRNGTGFNHATVISSREVIQDGLDVKDKEITYFVNLIEPKIKSLYGNRVARTDEDVIAAHRLKMFEHENAS